MDRRRFGPYHLVRQIAVGGMAEIHLAKTQGVAGFEKYVALKMIHPNFAEDEQFIQMLVDEAKIAVQLNHSNIAQTFDLGRVGNTYYITMEYVDGADLYRLLRTASEQELDMPLDVCAFVAKQVASALDHAHRKRDHTGKSLGIIHRDVSPQNVLISFAGEVKLVDFGIAKATMNVRQTAAGVIKGKYYYMSPEQAWGEQLDARSDIFSAGIVLYEMITGQMLYLEEDLHRLLEMARKANIAPPSTLRAGIPAPLERIVMRALSKLPERRYQTAADLANDLERFLHSYSPVATPTKLASLVRQVLGDPGEELDQGVAVHAGSNATFTLNPDDLIHDKEELRDENSVIFKVAELKQDAASRKPRQAHEETREVSAAPPRSPWDNVETDPGVDGRSSAAAGSPPEWEGGGIDGSGEHTLISEPPVAMDLGVDDGEPVDATLITAAPTETPFDDDATTSSHNDHDEDGPTINRSFVPIQKSPRPAALAANIQPPAVSELRKPRASRRTPASGNVLQAIVGNRKPEAMPSPVSRSTRSEDSTAATLPGQTVPGFGLPLSPITPTPGQPVQMMPGVPPHLQPYAMQQAAYPPHAPGYAQPPYGTYPQAQMSPGAMYPMNPYGSPPQPMTLTGQMRLLEADEIPPQWRMATPGHWVKLVIAGLIAISVAAGVTFFIIRSTRDTAPAQGAIHVDSVPQGAEVLYDGTRLAGTTPMSIDAVPVGTRHELRIEIARHKPYVESVDVPKEGGDVPVTAMLKPITGKLRIATKPDGADIYLDGQLRGRTSTTLNDIDMATATKLELRMKDYRPYVQNLEWPASGEIDLDIKLEH